ADADVALFVELERPCLVSLLSEHLRRCGHCRRRGPGCQDIASDRIHHLALSPKLRQQLKIGTYAPLAESRSEICPSPDAAIERAPIVLDAPGCRTAILRI